MQAEALPAWTATLVGFCLMVLSNYALIISGDYLYRLRHEEGADGFVSMRRPAPYGKPAAQPVTAASIKPRRPIEWAFFLSIALAVAGTIVALGALAGAQANCTPEELTWRVRLESRAGGQEGAGAWPGQT